MSYFLNTTIQTDNEPQGDYRNIVPRRWLAAWLGSISVVSFFGNFLVVLCVALNPKLRTIVNVYITSLAVNDMLVSLIIPWIIVGLVSTRGWPLPEWTCILVAILRFGCSGSSVWHLVAIGFNRMILITTSNATYRKIYSPVRTVIYLLITWLIPFCVILVPYAIGATELGYDSGPHLCSDLEERPDGLESVTHAYLAGTFLTCIPLAIVLCLYMRIYIHIRLHVRRQNAWEIGQQQQPPQNTAVATVSSTVQDIGLTAKQGIDSTEVGKGSNIVGAQIAQVPSNPSTSQNTQNPTAATGKPAIKKRDSLENRITKNTFYAVLGFILCIIPYGIAVLKGQVGPRGVPVAQGFIMFNICMNPVIYGTKHPHFRAAIRNIFTGRIRDPLVTSSKVKPVTNQSHEST